MNTIPVTNKRRFSLAKIAGAVTAIYVFFTALGIIFLFLSPAANKQVNIDEVFSWNLLTRQAISIVFSTGFYFFSINRYYQLIANKKQTTDFLSSSLLALLLVALYFIGSYFFSASSGITIGVSSGVRVREQLTPSLLVFSYVVSSIFYIGIALLVAYLTYLRDEKQQRKILEAQKMQLEVEKSQANYNFLKAQINPHFLHNTLNFLYSRSLPYSPELSEGILTLSDIMRYALGPAAQEGKVALKEEIEHVRNVIKINQLRFSNNLHLRFDVEGVINGATIVPFILITLVENAFKHGDLKCNQHPIDIRLTVQDTQIRFYCRNRKKKGPKEMSTGIGLVNIKNQLDLTYGKNYILHVRDEDEFYTTELIINAYDKLPGRR